MAQPKQPGIVISIDEGFDMALRLHQGNHPVPAEMLYRRIIQAVPEHIDALTYYGLLCHQQHRREEAAGLLARIVEIAPDNADAHNNLGNVLEGLGRKKDAEACYRNAISINPDHAPALNNLGVVCMARGAVDEALAAYDRAVRLSPETADYRYNQANALKRCHRINDAVTAYRSAVKLDATHVGAWQGLARTLIESGRKDAALAVFDAWLEKEPQNPVALYLQASCKGQGAPGRAPDAFVQKTFDDMADTFDEHLTADLNYRAPQLLIEAIREVFGPGDRSLNILDAGCGTGLCGPLLRPYARKLVGVDLSAGMLTRARGDNHYDELIQTELTEFLNDQNGVFDLILSADTLCYFGDLVSVLSGAAQALKTDGVLAFTLEDAGDATAKWHLNRHGRYAHGQRYVTQMLTVAGFALARIDSVILRNEGGDPVNGHLVVATI